MDAEQVRLSSLQKITSESNVLSSRVAHTSFFDVCAPHDGRVGVLGARALARARCPCHFRIDSSDTFPSPASLVTKSAPIYGSPISLVSVAPRFSAVCFQTASARRRGDLSASLRSRRRRRIS